MNIELRWVERVIPNSTTRAGGIERPTTKRVLQYRELDDISEVVDVLGRPTICIGKRWSDWRDVPVEAE